MIDSIRSLGSNYGSYNMPALSQGQQVSSAGEAGQGGGEGCCCCHHHGQDSVSFSPEAMQMMAAQGQAA